MTKKEFKLIKTTLDSIKARLDALEIRVLRVASNAHSYDYWRNN